MPISTLKNSFEDFLALFFPEYCLGCSDVLYKHEQNICLKCQMSMPLANYHQSAQESPLGLKFKGRVPLRFALAYLIYQKGSMVQSIIHKLKYDGEREVGVHLGRLYGLDLKASGLTFDLIAPVPLHPHKEQQRGYNQAAAFGEGLSEVLSIPMKENLLYKTVFGQSQTKKSTSARWLSVENTFATKYPQDIANKHILLVDDVVTTGSTLEACSQVLLKAGCSAVSIAAIANAQ
ncbi:MAG: ComF family protein [Cytophagales bacterium]|nr:MAG: ComF family protein [Cytophagales bacterium]TAF60105.1 MAG: ComF family protein [Cytophagales bacterium]